MSSAPHCLLMPLCSRGYGGSGRTSFGEVWSPALAEDDSEGQGEGHGGREPRACQFLPREGFTRVPFG